MAIIDKAGACVALAAVLLVASGAPAASHAAKCEAAKLKVAGTYSLCRLKVQAKEVKTGMVGRSDFAKCETTFTDKWAKAETKGGSSCPTSGDAGRVQSLVDLLATSAGFTLAGVRFVDNGDGTVTDTQTGLMWEKKDNLDGNSNLADPHDADNMYTWSASGVAPDGTGFTSFLAQLNSCAASSSASFSASSLEFTIEGGFAGHCDWRLPNILELIEIEDNTQGVCGGGSGPCIDPTFGPTTANGYWSGTTYAGDATEAWFWYFGAASGTNYAPKVNDPAWFRAVRSGL